MKMVTGVFQAYNRLKPDGEIEKMSKGCKFTLTTKTT